MKKRILRYLKHILITLLIGFPLFILIGLLNGNTLKYNRNELVNNWHNEGPFIFFTNDSSININYVKGNLTNGFELNTKTALVNSSVKLECFYPLDSSIFSFTLNPSFNSPKPIYNDSHKILAISDIESNYKAFRNFLIGNKVIDQNLNWIFGRNHLVLVGDFIDRSYFTTQVLWFIYKLEQDASSQGGEVHYILGNHEILNMQGDHRYAKSKYNHVASIIDKKQFELYGKNSFMGRWLESKNTLELINGNLFVHGGLSPDLELENISLSKINQLIRDKYYQPYYPQKNGNKLIEKLTSPETSPYWYRGYFKDKISPDEIEAGLDQFDAKMVIVGHTIQPTIKRKDKVIGIDVKHPADYYDYFPKRKSEGLLIENGNYYRVFSNGEKEQI